MKNYEKLETETKLIDEFRNLINERCKWINTAKYTTEEKEIRINELQALNEVLLIKIKLLKNLRNNHK